MIIKKREGDGYSETNVYILVGTSGGQVFACDRNGRIFSVQNPFDYEVTAIDSRSPSEIIQENVGS